MTDKSLLRRWLDQASKNVLARYFEGEGEGSFAELPVRVRMIARFRWLMLGIFCVYGAGAFFAYRQSEIDFFLSPAQALFMVICLLLVVFYNAFYNFFPTKYVSKRRLMKVQAFFDLLFVTMLVHLTGGDISWAWPLYLMVTFEAAILFDRRRSVIGFGFLGSVIFGFLLFSEYVGVLHFIEVPFFDDYSHHNILYSFLFWVWVCLLNGVLSIAATFLMNAIRHENQEVRTSKENLANFLESATDLIFSFTPEGEILYANHAWHEALKYDPQEVSQIKILQVIEDASRAKCMSNFKRVLEGEPFRVMEGRFVACDGSLIDIEGHLTLSLGPDGKVVLWAICRDITERKNAERQLFHLAHHDQLTGLPNRMYFVERLKQAQALAKRQGHKYAVIFVDLDRFKIINDTLGHAVGDSLLKETATRISSAVREIDTVGRLGGDEFIVLVSHLHDLDDALLVARKLLKSLAEPMLIDGNEIFLTLSLGIAVYPDHSQDPLKLIKQADLAMYSAKAAGRNNYQIYAPSMDQDSDRRMQVEKTLRGALDNREFFLVYQPKVDVFTGKITALEGLLRWQHPEMGLLQPGDFISLAEDTGLICPIGEWVLEEACRQNKQWQEMGLPKVRIAVNVSGYQLQQHELLQSIQDVLNKTGLEPRWLELEITESVIMQNPEFAIKILSELRDLGVYLAIDDFGTGYSSLAHLKRFHVNSLKIDKSFVRDVENNSTDAAITTAIIEMGKSLDMCITAEGVETQGQMSFLHGIKCNEIQGFLLSRPVRAGEIEGLLRKEGFGVLVES